MPRKFANDNGELWLAEGEYGKDPRNNVWYARPPGMHAGSLEGHQVIEHEDDTITVLPSILITQHDDNTKVEWHGFLERGLWRQVNEGNG